jgi:hypothetical protein
VSLLKITCLRSILLKITSKSDVQPLSPGAVKILGRFFGDVKMVKLVRVFSVGGVEVGRVSFADMDARGLQLLISKRLRSKKWTLINNASALSMLGISIVDGVALNVCDVFEYSGV